MGDKYDIISVGDATIDTVVTISQASVACKMDKRDCVLQLSYADKLPVDDIAQKVAGNAANNAVGCARTGKRVAFFTILGVDQSGDVIESEMLRNNVDNKLIQRLKNAQTNASTVINFKGERTILVYHAPRKYSLPKLPDSDWLYYTSVGENHKKLNKQLIAHVKKTGLKLCYNPGTYQFLEGIDEVKKVCAVCHILFVNVEESARIVGKKKDVRSYASALHKLGVELVVITDGRNGSYVYDGHTLWYMGIYEKTPVIERTGAGDSYASGFITALMEDLSIEDAMLRGSINASNVVMNIGPQDGLLDIAGYKKFRKKWGTIDVSKI